MPLSRPGETPYFFEYAVKYAIKSSKKEWPAEVSDFDPTPIKIPAYQRKIVWGKDEIKKFLESKSILFGTVILAQTPQDEPKILLDGLQRFAIATAILNYLYPRVLSPTPGRQDIAEHFKRLKGEIGSKQPIFAHNDKALREYTRIGISTSYKQLYENVKSIINEELENPKEFAKKIVKTFVNNQIAIDGYYGFKSSKEFTQTFININSTGIDLSEVDLLRSKIIQQAEDMKWSDDEIDYIENKFTETFQSGRIKEAKVLGKNLYDVLEYDVNKVFRNWESLKNDDVIDLLDFIEHIYDAAKEKNEKGDAKWPYLYEIVECGHLPFTVTTWFFYKKVHLEGKEPDFLGGTVDTSSDLHILLRAFYRRIIDGSIGRIGPIVTNFIKEKYEAPIDEISELADKINPPDIEKLNCDPDKNWLSASLKKANINKVRRIFNACLLPNRKNMGDRFCPLSYGSASNQWTIDHLIPKINRQRNQEGSEQIEQIINLAPLRSSLNKKARELPCLEKMGQNGFYNKITDDHPYINWLINVQYKKYKKARSTKNTSAYAFDSLECLSNVSGPHIGKERLTQLTGMLVTRL